MKKRKLIVSAITIVLLGMLYSVIFSFSGQDAEKSGSISTKVSETVVEVADKLTFRHWTESVKKDLANDLEHPVRKAAHFTEYLLMAVLLFVLWIQWIPRNKRFYALIIAWVFLSAAADEFHQRFVPGRSGNLSDVLLDTCGGIFGILICLLVRRVVRRLRLRRNRSLRGNCPQ